MPIPADTRIVGFLASAVPIGLAACGSSDAEVAREAARAACAATMQALYRPTFENEAVTFERVPDTATGAERFEFNWKQSQISNLTWMIHPQEYQRAERPATGDGTYTVVIEQAGAERRYICRGSLKARSIHGIWLQRTDARGQVRDIRLTQHPISF